MRTITRIANAVVLAICGGLAGAIIGNMLSRSIWPDAFPPKLRGRSLDDLEKAVILYESLAVLGGLALPLYFDMKFRRRSEG